MEQLYSASGTESLTPDALWRKRIGLEKQRCVYDGEEGQLRGVRKRLLVLAAKSALRLSGLYARGLRNAFQIELRAVEFTFPQLPEALNGFRILHLSDFHFRRGCPAFSDTIAESVKGLEADICLLSGDFRFGHCGAVDHVPGQLAHVLRGVQTRHGTFSVLGNHDVSQFAEMFPALGVTMLVNRGVAIEMGDAVLWIGGIDDPHGYRCHSVEHALRHAPHGAFRILLAHSPEAVQEASRHAVDLYLCGHTHGGQIRLPIVGAIETNAPSAPRQCLRGKWTFGTTQGYTNVGLGATDLPVRYNCPPEAALITLRRV